MSTQHVDSSKSKCIFTFVTVTTLGHFMYKNTII